MKKATKDAWLARLRDPNSKQATNALSGKDGSRCALGWLCLAMEDVTGADRWDYPLSERLQLEIIRMNDGKKLSLPEIADWIEENIVGA